MRSDYLVSLEEAKRIIEEMIRSGEAKVGYASEFEDTFGHIIGRFSFRDFVRLDNGISDRDYNILNVYDFETVYTTNYHHMYANYTWIKLHQLNYGIDIPDITDEGDLQERLLERIEFVIDDFDSTDDLYSLLYLFGDVIDLFYSASEEILFSISFENKTFEIEENNEIEERENEMEKERTTTELWLREYIEELIGIERIDKNIPMDRLVDIFLNDDKLWDAIDFAAEELISDRELYPKY